MTAPPLLLHLEQVSGEAFDSHFQATMDFDEAFETQPNAAGFTEVSRKGHRDALAAACTRAGYQLRGGVGDTAIALHRGHKILNFRSVVAHSGGRDSFGPYGARTLEVLTADVQGETITFIEGHWVRPKNPDRRRKHRIMTDLAIQLLKENSRGTDLAIAMGDLNEDDDPTEPLGSAGRKFRDAGITTIWDELGVYPRTGPGGGTIDFMASVNADTRLQALGVQVWKPGFSDHPRVSGFWAIERRAPRIGTEKIEKL